MSRWRLGQTSQGVNSFAHIHRERGLRGRARGDGGRFKTSFRMRFFGFRIVNLAALCCLFFVGGLKIASAQVRDSDKAVYARAVEFCRGVAKRPMALDLDKRVLCLDGVISSDADFSLAGAQRANGLFVIRSFGGFESTAIALANMLRDRRATVVVYDYCISACASFLLVASDETFVMKDTIVAWHHTSWPFCPSLEESKDGGPKRLEKLPCADTSLEYQRGHIDSEKRTEEFYADRVVDPQFQDPPQSFTMRKRLRSMFEGTGGYPDVVWTWNPRYYASTLKTKITYEAYPSSQDEVDALALKLFGNLRLRVLYDP